MTSRLRVEGVLLLPPLLLVLVPHLVSAVPILAVDGDVPFFLHVQLSSFAPLWPRPRSAHILSGRCGFLLLPVRTPGKVLPLCCWVSNWTMTVFPVAVPLHPLALLPVRFPQIVVYGECEVPWLRSLPFP